MPRGLEKITGPHVYVEGTDLTGKDTLGEYLQFKMNYDQLHKLVVCESNPFELEITRLGKEDKVFIGVLTAKSLLYEIVNMSLRKPTLLISSHVLRGLSVETAMKKPLQSVFEELIGYYPQFDTTLLLTASLEAKKNRLQSRTTQQTSDLDSKVIKDPEFVLLMDEVIKKYAISVFNAIVIDTSELSTTEVKNLAMSEINTNKVKTISKKIPTLKHSEFLYITKVIEDYEKFLKKRRKL